MDSMSRTAGNLDFIDFQLPKKKAKTPLSVGLYSSTPVSTSLSTKCLGDRSRGHRHLRLFEMKHSRV